jgi:exopolysaccharide biosynthesis predicted pyruvyltransferase EpsI
MNSKEKINELNNIIHKSLKPIVNNNYIFLDLPYYTNIGDTLIWKGTEEFLKEIPFKCLYRASLESYHRPKIDKNVIILLQGGGNFGDLYSPHNEFRLRVISEFPENPIIILPQTVYYKCDKVLSEHASEFGKHPDLTICARDLVTLELLNNRFSKNKVILLPDMAFCIPESFFNQYQLAQLDRVLFFKRTDPEILDLDYKGLVIDKVQIDQHDWPTLEVQIIEHVNLHRLFKLRKIISKISILENICDKIINWYAINIYMPKLLKIGIEFISPYSHVYSTRLHGAILAILLHKNVSFLDNSYGKNSNFYHAWLEGLDSFTMVGESKLI